MGTAGFKPPSRPRSRAGTYLKVGALVRRDSRRHQSGANRRKFFGGRASPLSKRTVNRFDERFRDGQYSLVSFLFTVLLLRCSPCQAICKSGGGHVPPCCIELAPLRTPPSSFALVRI